MKAAFLVSRKDMKSKRTRPAYLSLYPSARRMSMYSVAAVLNDLILHLLAMHAPVR